MASAHPSWFDFLAVEAHKPYFSELRARVVAERERFEVYPPPGLVMSAFSTPLAFNGVAPPPSLQRIRDELYDDIGPRGAPGVSDVDWRL